jgi:hypothetical protein
MRRPGLILGRLDGVEPVAAVLACLYLAPQDIARVVVLALAVCLPEIKHRAGNRLAVVVDHLAHYHKSCALQVCRHLPRRRARPVIWAFDVVLCGKALEIFRWSAGLTDRQGDKYPDRYGSHSAYGDGGLFHSATTL